MNVSKKEQIKYDKSFADYYKITGLKSEEDFLLDENIFCKSLIRFLHRNSIFSFNDLINANMAKLLNQRDIGKVKFNELIDCINKVANRVIDIEAIRMSQKKDIPYSILVNRNVILNGDFTCLTGYPELYEKYTLAYNILGSEMIAYCMNDKSNKIILCLNEFAKKNHLKSERKKRIEKVITSIPEIRKHKSANQFIDVYCSYSNNFNDYAILKTTFSSGKLTLSSKQIEDIVDNDTYYSVINFLTWVSFSVEHTQNVIMKSILDNCFKRKVLKKRAAESKSFQTISEELNCKKELVKKVEKKLVQDFSNHKYKTMLFDFILLDTNISKIEELKLNKLVQLLDYDSAVNLLYLIKRSLKNKYNQ